MKGAILAQLLADRAAKRPAVLVTDLDGHLIKDKATAAQRTALTLKFADGTLDVSTGAAPPPPRPAPKPRSPATPGNQQELF